MVESLTLLIVGQNCPASKDCILRDFLQSFSLNLIRKSHVTKEWVAFLKPTERDYYNVWGGMDSKRS